MRDSIVTATRHATISAKIEYIDISKPALVMIYELDFLDSVSYLDYNEPFLYRNQLVL